MRNSFRPGLEGTFYGPCELPAKNIIINDILVLHQQKNVRVFCEILVKTEGYDFPNVKINRKKKSKKFSLLL